MSWRRRREPAVVRELADLERDGYRILPHREGSSDALDRIVVGPTGVFLIRVNQWPGRFYFERDGWFHHSRNDPGELVSQVTREAGHVRFRLGGNGSAPEVEGVVVVSRSSLPHPVIQMGWVTFVAAPELGSYLRSRRRGLSTEQVDRVAADIHL